MDHAEQRRWLIRQLLDEEPDYRSYSVPEDTQEQKVLKLIADVKSKCKETLETLDETRKGESNSSSYEKMHSALVEGTKLGNETSLNEMTEFLKKLTRVSKSYDRAHDILGGPFTYDGMVRLNESRELDLFGKKAAEELKEISKGMGDRNGPIGIRATDRSARIEQMKEKQVQQQAAENKEPQKAADPEVFREPEPVPVL